MEFPNGLKYSKEHEWVRVEDNKAIIGITDHAQGELGEIVFVDLPEAGGKLEVAETFGIVESVKTVSDLYAPVSGSIKEVNGALEDDPEIVNNDPYGDGWMLVVEMDDPSQIGNLLTNDEYQQYIEDEKDNE